MQTKLLERIQKLLAMANGNGNANEAAIAMRRARALMDKHNLTMEDLGESELGTLDFVGPTKSVKSWQRLLFGTIAETFDCTLVIQRTSGKTIYRYFGTKSGVEVCSYVAAVLLRKLETDRRQFYKDLGEDAPKTTAERSRARNHFNFSWSYAILSKVRELARTEEDKQRSAAAIEQAEQFRDKLSKNLRASRSLRNPRAKSMADLRASQEGYNRGSAHSIFLGVNQNSTQTLSN